MIAIHIQAPNCVNGNPRRCFLILNDVGHTLTVLDEGHSQWEVVREWSSRNPGHIYSGGTINVPVSEYKTLIETGDHLRKYHVCETRDCLEISGDNVRCEPHTGKALISA